MPPKNNPSQTIARSISLFLLIGAVGWLLALSASASAFRSRPADKQYNMRIGPLMLNTFSRHTIEHGEQIDIGVKPGLPIYFLTCTTAGLLTGLYRIKINKR